MFDVMIRATVVLAVAWLTTCALRRASAATRHLVWHLALVAILVLPLAAPLAPRFELPWLNLLSDTLPAPLASISDMQAGRLDVPPLAEPRPSSASSHDSASTQTAVRPRRVAFAQAAIGARYLWLAGTFLLGLWFAAGWMLSARLVRQARPAPSTWSAELDALRRRLGVPQRVELRLVDRSVSPLAAGLRRSTILLPATAAIWCDERRHAVLLHELAHIKRRDCRIQVVAQAACALYWFNPLAWRAFAELRNERERACDDEVLKAGTRASSYATHLLDIARELKPARAPRAALAMARPTELEGRLLAVLASSRARSPRPASRWLVAALITLTTFAALGATPAATVTREDPSRQLRPSRDSMLGKSTVGEQIDAYRAQTAASSAIERAPDPDTRERAVMELAAAASDTTIPALTRALNDRSADVREKAAFALGLLSNASVIPGLLKALEDRDPQVREKAALGLAFRRDARVVDALMAALEDEDGQVREKAAMALGTCGDLRATAALTKALDDPDDQVREKAAMGLGLLNTSQPDEETGRRVRSGLSSLVGAFISLTR
jgi:beta-lactamase regulating signal transducer with metallopeptidase domain